MTKYKNIFGDINIPVSKCFFNNNSFKKIKTNKKIDGLSEGRLEASLG